MDSKTGNAAAENIHTFVPASDLIQEEECDTLLIYLTGFTKDHLRVQLTRTGVLKISGATQLGENKWSTFQKDFPVPENCDTSKISAKFEGGILYVRLPKLTVSAEKKDQKIPPLESSTAPRSQKTDQEREKPAKIDDKNKQKSDYKEQQPEAKVEEKSRESEGDKGDERKRDSVSSGLESDYKLKAEKLKMARKMTMVLAVVLAFALGMYISKYMVGFEKKAES